MPMESTKKRYRYLIDLFEVNHINKVPRPREVIEGILEEENFEERKEEIKADKCLRCGSEEDLVLYKPNFKEEGKSPINTFKGWNYQIARDEFNKSHPDNSNWRKLDQFILENFEDINQRYEEELDNWKKNYRSLSFLDDYITLCERCKIIIEERDLYLCQKCEENFHKTNHYCFECMIEEKDLKKCPICQEGYYRPEDNDKCKSCRT